jgi:hypothetical protein
VFYGEEGGPWRWICEEAINPYQQRKMGIAGDGTLYATDRQGVTISRDGGCTWEPAGQPLAGLRVEALSESSDAPSRMWIAASAGLASSGGGTAAGLYRSDDQGRTFVAALPLEGRSLSGLAVAGDGRTLVVASRNTTAPFDPRIHVSVDAGATFTAHPVTFMLDGSLAVSLTPRAVDPRDPRTLYFSLDGGPAQLLLRSTDGGATLAELLRLDKPIEGVAIDPVRDQLLVASAAGLHVGVGTAAPTRSPALSRTQCVEIHAGKTYACAWNWDPDSKAVGRSDDGAASFTKVFQYADTEAPIDCPATTPVGMMCPTIWASYADQLGIDLGLRGDGGAGAGGVADADGGAGGTAGSAGSAATPPGKSSGCAPAGGGAPGGAGGGALLGLGALATAMALRARSFRRRR